MRSPITVDDEPGAPAEAQRARSPGVAPVVIEARGIEKSFQIPEERIDTFKERATHPFQRVGHRQLHALRDVSFDVRRGEFFGIVGRNGSGKSSLLKILAGIYRPDAGRVRVAGRVAPFIELGVGFNPDLTGRENAVLNGVLMGLTRREARRRLDAIFDFADLRDFAELRLKNYSSGMMVRLAFAVMVQAEADIMLIDEVLAVGDAAFAQKCMDVFQERRRAGQTVVLVTHAMETVQSLCHRAMLLEEGKLQVIGDPETAARRYFQINFAGDADTEEPEGPAVPDINASVVQARLVDEDGGQIENVAQGVPLGLDVVLETRRRLTRPMFVVQVRDANGLVLFSVKTALERESIEAGERVHLRGEIENALVPGRYFVDCWVRRDREKGDLAIQGLRLFDFVVYGAKGAEGIVTPRADLRVTAERGAGA